ncbi:MAG: heavy metal translocating P-type ATPase [Chloroflexi bacterium]|nr:heavy metal translocating P-type ATPase [Chloroflexota bacterium]
MIKELFPVLKDAALHAWSKMDPLDPASIRARDSANTPGIRMSKSAYKPQETSTATVNTEPASRISALAQAKFQAEDRALDQDLALSAAALGVTTVGALVAHPLVLLSLPFLLKLSIPYWRAGYRSLVEQRKIDRAVFDAAVTTGLFASGLFSLLAFLEGAQSLSKKLVLRTRNRSEQALTGAFGEQPRKVWIVAPSGQEIEIPFEELKPGDQVIVSGGQRIPADGYITRGIATIDRRMLTGESQPGESGVGDSVFASTLVVSGQIFLRVEKSGQETTAAQIADILRNTADYQSSVELWSQRFADQVALPQLALTAAALPVAGAQGAMAVLVSDVAWDARVTGPLSVLNFLNLATKQGILVKDGRALELLSKVNTIVFDKTGTLTLEQPELGRIYVHNGLDENQLLTYAASAESRQTHPFARAILQAAQARQLDLSASQDAHYQEGFGILVHLPDVRVHVGSARYMDMEGIDIPTDWRALQAAGHAQGYSYVYVAVNRRLSGMIELRPAIRPEVKHLVQQLKARNLSLYILSGDHQQVTAALAEQLGIEHYLAEVLPAGKAEIVERLQADGASVCFVGDGINDAIALKKAHVSVSLRGASTVAADVASIVLLDGNLEKLGRLFEIADGLHANLRTDLLASFVPGAAAIGGVFLFHLGVLPAFVIGMGGFTVGMVNSMLPRLMAGNEEKTESKA